MGNRDHAMLMTTSRALNGLDRLVGGVRDMRVLQVKQRTYQFVVAVRAETIKGGLFVLVIRQRQH